MDVVLESRIYQTGGLLSSHITLFFLTLEPEPAEQEYEDCWQLVRDCIPHVNIEKNPENADSFSASVCSDPVCCDSI